MGNNKCLIILMIFSWSFFGLCQGQGIGDIQPPKCAKPLLLCSMYIHQPSPPPACCLPLKKLISDDVKCICDVFSNPIISLGLNVTQADAMDLAKACGVNVGTSLCDNINGGSAPKGSPLPPNSSSSSPPPNTNPTPKSAASPVSKFGGSSIIVIFYFIISMF
ncbi:hypothetical protein LIER_31947 [Lithospermum erythrorhizon]|uniref:Bifunctional inhibitor/plant lipid transfer protein/seed storage helical domain-containing protein n=1 Tax=Lithospermum erythrorhizon TaxID=34254 RepID=A0AAV3RT93_LITER